MRIPWFALCILGSFAPGAVFADNTWVWMASRPTCTLTSIDDFFDDITARYFDRGIDLSTADILDNERMPLGSAIVRLNGSQLELFAFNSRAVCIDQAQVQAYMWQRSDNICRRTSRFAFHNIVSQDPAFGALRREDLTEAQEAYYHFGAMEYLLTAELAQCLNIAGVPDRSLIGVDAWQSGSGAPSNSSSGASCSRHLSLEFNISGRFDLDASLQVTPPYDPIISVHNSDSYASATAYGQDCIGGTYSYAYSVRLDNLLEDDYNTYTGTVSVSDQHSRCSIEITPYSGRANAYCQ